MSRKALIAAFDALAEAAHMVAIELEAQEQPDVSSPVRPAVAAGTSGPVAADTPDIDRCPKHGREWKEGQYGPFCTAQSDDPAWSNRRGYCRITPKNAPEWLAVQRAAA